MVEDADSVEVADSAQLRRFLDLSIDLLGILDLSTTILEVSQSWERTFGWHRSELIGTPLLAYFHEDDIPRIESELAGLLVGGEAVAVVVRIRARDGSYRWVQGNARADLDAERIFVTAADITERKELEDALRRQLALEELVATIAARLIAAEDADVPDVIQRGIGEVAWAMGAHRAHFLRGTRLQASTVIEWLHPEAGQRHHVPDPSAEVQRWWFDVLRSGRLLRLEDIEALAEEAPAVVEALRADGVRSILLVPLPPHRGWWGFLALVAIQDQVPFDDAAAALLRLLGEAFLTAFARGDDAAALLEARRELERRNDALERSNEELERFAYAAAHDLKAPLARIEMALAAAPVPDGDAGKLMEVARRGAGRMRQLIEDLLTFASVGTGAGAAEPVVLDDIVGQVVADFASTIATTGAEVTAEPLPTVWGQPALLEQLVQNLIGNALKFARPGIAARVVVSATSDVDGVTMRVADNGIGVEPGQRQDVFGVFTRLNANDQYPGSGIGLATCAKVVAHHSGHIWLEDGLAGGSTVAVWLPHPADRDR